MKIDYNNYEIIVIDYKTPLIEEYLKNFDFIKLVKLEGEDVGPSQMHNISLKYVDSNSKYIVFLDNDTILDNKWLKELVICIESDNNIGAVQSKLLLMDQKTLNSKGNLCNYLAVGWPNGYAESDNQEIGYKEISFPSGASMIVRKDIVHIIDGYDKDFFIYVDDLDFGLRIRLAGYKIYYCPKSIAYHNYKFLKNKRNFYYLNRNRLFTFFKLYNKKTYFYLIPPLIIYEIGLFFYAFLNSYICILIKIYSDTIRSINNIKFKRRQIKNYRRINDADLIKILGSKIDFIDLKNPGIIFILNPILSLWKILILKIIRER